MFHWTWRRPAGCDRWRAGVAMGRLARSTVGATILLFLTTLLSAAQDGRHNVVDSAGRTVEIPVTISRVLAAGPPASVLLYTLAPEKMIGWVRTPSAAEKPFLLASVRELPEYGRLTGRGGTANLENV